MSDIILEDFFDNVNIETSAEDEVNLEDTTKYINLIYHRKYKYVQFKDDPEVIKKLVNKIKNKVYYWFDNVFEKVGEPQIRFYYLNYESSEYIDNDNTICSISFEISIDGKTTRRMLKHLINVVFDTVFSEDYKIYCFNLSDKKSVDCEPGDIITLDRYSYDELGHSKITSDIMQSLCDELCYNNSLNEDFFDEIEVDNIEDDNVEIENKDYDLDMFFVWSLAPMHNANLEDTFIRANRLKRQIHGISKLPRC